MNLLDPVVGARLLQSADPQEVEQVTHLLDALFVGDVDGRQLFADRMFGRGNPLTSARDSSAITDDVTDNINTNVDQGSTSTSPGGSDLGQLKDNITKLLPMINASPAQESPLLALKKKVEAIFNCGPDAAIFIFLKLQQSVTGSTYKRQGPRIEIDISANEETELNIDQSVSHLWKSCKMATTLILLFASSNDPACMQAALKLQSHSLGGLPTYESIQKTPSASLLQAFQRAKAVAVGEAKTTVMAVSLTDVHIFTLAKRGGAEQYFSFAHVFTLGVGPEGVMIWQAWGKHGYRLDEYLRDGHARLRDWDEADQFVRDFEKLASGKGMWNAKSNKLYKKLFLVDINQICGPNGPERPVTPRFKAWVRINTIENVTYDNITKFHWV
ncbi:hypothetical protein Forpi1262_v009491 [Fusarium oxysporum f. sp. raphani]|uniref:Uncharacterized protein n=1 Tax=Fusarium oxysporum f. sp. raphani TaxID=96318 RepID=A0A8J5U5T9_FUSOX|nr:hypothetical protein Forpi1262_v009491 [Fusarium oxysporum f. sp. raphani]